MALSASTLVEALKSTTSYLAWLQIVPTGNYTTGGDVLDLTKIVVNASGVSLIKAPPLCLVAGGLLSGYSAQIVPGTNTANLATAYKIKFFSAAGTELAAAAYPAVLLAGNVVVLISKGAF